ncbi:hypothetical protein [Desulfurivibrio alkaliphilus]|uniref:Uncharacterized protein n=1 Tax=Desulfurivibrio alkaliphilus (strain DSM 19089 / UNIQEM U267 / AHT2) TaxID=589865 RepID=D6Z2D8_DESAT|nr:hypothetical protein [Desulfurivibrio alkaliphilus]ADH85713.1 hypothetical protein DaAHT2_1013 [Desulfurivibrio alkaliphilus AHT 2]
MTKFRRSGHWRTNSYGTTFWVGEHDVNRDDWDRFSCGQSVEKHINETIKPYCYSYFSFINPNATCPVCGEPVFYYESPYGGKVYFDSLGPPWPKHPCIDYVVTGSKSQNVQYKNWVNELWQPFQVEEIKKFDATHYEVVGILLKEFKKQTIFFNNNEIKIDKLKKNLSHVKIHNDKSVWLSTFEIEKSNNNVHIQGFIFKGSLLEPSVRTIIEESIHKGNTQPTTLMDAFKKAIS